jgi:hypothetical protein
MLHTSWQQKVFTKLLGMNYKVLYKKGVENRVVDALSRNPSHADDSLSCPALSVVQPKWLEKVIMSIELDTYSSDLMAKLLLDSSSVPDFSLHKGLLRYKGKIWVGNDQTLQLKLISVFHCSAVGGHSGVLVTYRKLNAMFAWKGLKAVVH